MSQRETLRMIVERMRWLRAAGWLEREIADHLNDYELRTPSWRRCWTQASVSYWLRHEAYPSGRAA